MNFHNISKNLPIWKPRTSEIRVLERNGSLGDKADQTREKDTIILLGIFLTITQQYQKPRAEFSVEKLYVS